MEYCHLKMCVFDPLFVSEPPVSSLSRATNIIKDFLKQKSMVKFRAYDVLDLLQPLVPGQTQTEPADQVRPDVIYSEWNITFFFPPLFPVSAHFLCSSSAAAKEPAAGPSGCQQLRQLLNEALQILQDEGVVYCKLKSQEGVYQVRSPVVSHFTWFCFDLA